MMDGLVQFAKARWQKRRGLLRTQVALFSFRHDSSGLLQFQAWRGLLGYYGEGDSQLLSREKALKRCYNV